MGVGSVVYVEFQLAESDLAIPIGVLPPPFGQGSFQLRPMNQVVPFGKCKGAGSSSGDLRYGNALASANPCSTHGPSTLFDTSTLTPLQLLLLSCVGGVPSRCRGGSDTGNGEETWVGGSGVLPLVQLVRSPGLAPPQPLRQHARIKNKSA